MKIHFIGIGGIGMSALAQYYLNQGHKVSGSDLASSEITDLLRKKGAKVFIGKQKISNIKTQISKSKNCLIIYSPAVQKNNPELKIARKLGIKCLTYPEALGELTKKYFTIAVSGTHGKSTTTAMLAVILIKAGFDPTVIVGTKLREFGNSNFRAGKSKYLLIEADEHFASFLNYWPKIIVITNIERDHLDYYKNLKNIKKAFCEFVGHLPPDGILVFNADDKNSKLKIKASRAQFKIQKYSLRQKEANKLRKILQVPGEHNVSNALAALTVARALGISDKISFKALSEYRGAWRRFEIKEFKIKNLKFKIVSDYAHHPTEIKATIRAAKEKFPGQKIWVVFQPHQIERTVSLFDDFVTAFDEADVVVLTNIFKVAGREKKNPPKGKDIKALMSKIKKRRLQTYFISDLRKIPKFLKKMLWQASYKKLGREDVILIMGAGDIYLIGSSKYWKK